MSNLLEKFWKKANLPVSTLETLVAEYEEGEEPNLDELADSFTSTFIELNKGEMTKGMLTKEHMDDEFKTYKRKVANEINKIAGLGLTRSELKEISIDDIYGKAKDFISKKLSEASKATDEDLQNELTKTQNELIEARHTLQDLEDKFDSRIAEIQAESKAEVNTFHVNQVMNRKLDSIDWAHPKHIKIYKAQAIREIKENYHIEPDGSIFHKNAVDKAPNWAKNGFYQHVDEAIDEWVSINELDSKSRGGTDPAVGTGTKIPTDKLNKSAAAGSLAERAMIARRNAL